MIGVKTFAILLGCRRCLQYPIYGFSYMDTKACEFSGLLWKMEVFKQRFLALLFILRQASLSSVVNSFGFLFHLRILRCLVALPKVKVFGFYSFSFKCLSCIT